MTGGRPVLLGLLLYVLVAVVPTLAFWVALRLVPAVASAVAERRRVRAVQPGPSLEMAVGHLRRLRREIRGPQQTTHVRQVALFAAYDERLLELCDIVGVDAPLGAADRADRAFARLLTEAALEDAGIALDPPASGTAAA